MFLFKGNTHIFLYMANYYLIHINFLTAKTFFELKKNEPFPLNHFNIKLLRQLFIGKTTFYIKKRTDK